MDSLFVEKQAQAKVLWVLNKIKNDQAIAMSGTTFEYRLDDTGNPAKPTRDDQKAIIDMLVKRSVLQATPFYELFMTQDYIAELAGYEPVGYRLKLAEPSFGAFYKEVVEITADSAGLLALDGTSFNDREAMIFFREKTCQLRTNSKEHLFCRHMYACPPMTAVEQGAIWDLFAGSTSEMGDKNDMRSVYETMVRLNKKVNKDLVIDKLFISDGGSIKRRF